MSPAGRMISWSVTAHPSGSAGPPRHRSAAAVAAAARDAHRADVVPGSSAWAVPDGIHRGLGPSGRAASVSSARTRGSTRSPAAGYARPRPDAAPAAGPARPQHPILPACDQTTRLGCLFEIVETLVLTLIIFFVIQTFVAQPYQVQQQSMERTLEPEQYVLVDKLTPRFDTYKRGDIVVFNPPATGPGGRHAVHQAGHRRGRRHGRDPATGKVYVNGDGARRAVRLRGRTAGRRSRPTTARPGRSWVVPDGRAVPDGRPPLATRPTRAMFGTGRDRRTSSAGPGCATGRSTRSGSSRPRPTRSSRPAAP